MTGASATTRRRLMRLAVVLFAVLVYMGLDTATLSRGTTVPEWGLSVGKLGLITSVDPDGPAASAGLRVGDRIAQPRGTAANSSMNVAHQAVLHVARLGTVRAAPMFGPTPNGQALVLVGMLLLLVGGLAWAFGRGGRAPVLLSALSAAVALTLLGTTWGVSGYSWAIRLAWVAGTVLTPVSWATFFLSFPRNRLARRRWGLFFTVLIGLGVTALVTYALWLVAALPYDVAHVLGDLVFALGLLLGFAAISLGQRHEIAQVRQQWRLVALSAVAALLPTVVFAFIPDLLVGYFLVPYEVTALATALLPLGLAYAIVRYDLMGLDVVARRVVAVGLGALVLTTTTAAATLALHPLWPRLDLAALVVAVLGGAAGGHYVLRWSRRLAERLLAPELVRSRRLLTTLDATLLRGEDDLAGLAGRLEDAACAAAAVPWARLLVRRRGPGALFAASHAGVAHVSLPLLAASLSSHPWGLAPGEARGPEAPDEWRTLLTAFSTAPGLPAVLIPLCMRGEVIALLVVGERPDGAPVAGPDREAAALLLGHAALAVDHARVRSELEADGADAAALSAASARLASALDDRAALPGHIVGALAGLREVRSVSLLFREPDGTPVVAAVQGDVAPAMPPADLTVAAFSQAPVPCAWLPLMVGESMIGALSLRWSEEHAIREQDRRLLSVYTNGAAMALEHARLYEHARIQAERDPVTGLYNHRAFHLRLEAALDHARSTSSHVGLLLVDVADFKLFNDTHGHQAGDQALRRVGEVLQACCRTSDAAARLGGDEFAVLLPDATVEAAFAIAERITDLAAVSELMSPEGQRLPVRLSIGAAAFPTDAAAANALLARADESMYAAKRAGVPIAVVGPTGRDGDSDDSSRFGILESLVAMVDNRDRYTGEHSEQVAAYACAIAAEIGLSPDTIKTLRLAGLLHDVGKIGVPDRVLRKPDRLTDEEFDIVRRHVELSEVLLAVVSQDRDLMDAVRHHHERWDGRGYPRGIEGNDVPLLGRIMIVADAVSAMGMDRPYRKGLPWEHITQELTRGAGTQFDPALVAPAIRALRACVERVAAA